MPSYHADGTANRTAPDLDLLRDCRFSPYRKGMGPTFRLQMWDARTRDHRGVTCIRYRLTMLENGVRTVLFDAADYHGSPSHADDSDANVAGLMGFLTLRPGDTDAEYFDSYTAVQLDYAGSHAETLSCCVIDRFGEL